MTYQVPVDVKVTQLLARFFMECRDGVDEVHVSDHPLGRGWVRCGDKTLYIHGDWDAGRTYLEVQ